MLLEVDTINFVSRNRVVPKMIQNKISPSFSQSYCGCDRFHPRRCDASWSFTASSENLARANGEGGHVPSAVQKQSRYLASFTTEMASFKSADNFFLRPFLTREEYAYWNSRFCCVSSSCSFVYATNPKDSATVTSDEHTTSCVRNATELPCCDGRRPSGFPAVHGNGLNKNGCSDTRNGPMPCFPEFISSSTSHGIMNARKSQCPYSTNTSIKGIASQDKEFNGNPPSLEHLVPRTSQKANHLNRPYCCDTREMYGVHQESTPTKLREEMYGEYLCGDKSFDGKLPLVPSSSHEGVNPKTGPAISCDSSSAYGVHSELGSADRCQIKRKTASPSEHDHYSQGKCKKHCIGHDVNGFHVFQAPSEIKDANETWKPYQSHPPISSCCSKDARDTIDESRDTRKSRFQDCVEKEINTITSETRCKPGSNTLTETEPIIIDLTHDNSSFALKSRVPQVRDQVPNGRNKPLERKDIHEVIKTVKPVQRKLMTNKTASDSDGCAFDHDSLPRLIGVLPSAMATMMSSLGK
ncbi:uncharacterized protein LOC144662273 isoform X1 [Oculina patagonica]